MLRRLAIALIFVTAGCTTEDPYTGEPFTRTEKIQTRRLTPTEDELKVRPAPPYEVQLRAQEAERARLAVSAEMEATSVYLERSAKVMGHAAATSKDPWESYELDRRRVLARDWADRGPYPKLDPIVKPEQKIEDDPFKVIPKATKKPEGDAAADGDKPAGDKPAGDDKKDPNAPIGGEKKD